MDKIVSLLVAILILVAVSFVGCSHQEPFEYHAISEVPQGPGLLTGKNEAFVIWGTVDHASSKETEEQHPAN